MGLCRRQLLVLVRPAAGLACACALRRHLAIDRLRVALGILGRIPAFGFALTACGTGRGGGAALGNSLCFDRHAPAGIKVTLNRRLDRIHTGIKRQRGANRQLFTLCLTGCRRRAFAFLFGHAAVVAAYLHFCASAQTADRGIHANRDRRHGRKGHTGALRAARDLGRLQMFASGL